MGLLHRLRGDETLMQQYGQGNVAAFNELYSRHKDRLYGFLYRSVYSASTAEDLAQETWSTIIRQAVNYRPTASFSTYLFTIARRKLIDYHRRVDTRTETTQLDEDTLLATNGSTTAEQQVEISRLLELIKCLPSDQREAFLLKEEGFSLTDIAAIAGTGQETVKSRIRYARQTLRQQMTGGSDRND
ncbi:MAG: RNA polymerase sigma-70 factor (ECF subfamily) [Halieaceae bacterium]|jgi:RNA polymerase sigma-70 factor (ECF subfamily)